MGKRNGYAGSIRNAGVQIVEAPNQQTVKGKAIVRTGEDLRTGSTSKKSK